MAASDSRKSGPFRAEETSSLRVSEDEEGEGKAVESELRCTWVQL